MLNVIDQGVPSVPETFPRCPIHEIDDRNPSNPVMVDLSSIGAKQKCEEIKPTAGTNEIQESDTTPQILLFVQTLIQAFLRIILPSELI